MFGRLFGRKKKSQAEIDAENEAEYAFAEAKQAALEQALGPMEDIVLHAIIPFEIGGGLDLYFFSKCIPGTVIVTQELILQSQKRRPKANKLGYFELVACLPPGADRNDEKHIGLVQRALNPIARYASMASLNPGETAEIPGDEGEPSLPLFFDRFDTKGKKFTVNGEEFHLLLCMPLHQSELAYGRKEGTPNLLRLLKEGGVYPYANLDRKPVI